MCLCSTIFCFVIPNRRTYAKSAEIWINRKKRIFFFRSVNKWTIFIIMHHFTFVTQFLYSPSFSQNLLWKWKCNKNHFKFVRCLLNVKIFFSNANHIFEYDLKLWKYSVQKIFTKVSCHCCFYSSNKLFWSTNDNFINDLCAAFTLVDPESVKNAVKSSVSFYAFRLCACKSCT